MSVRKMEFLVRSSALPEGRAKLVVAQDGRRFVCVKQAGSVSVLDDQCPHEGHPLSMGLVRDGVLTCPWHNWRFELSSGACVFGEESVRRYEAAVHDGEVFIEAARSSEDEFDRLRKEFERSLFARTPEGALRVALRMRSLGKKQEVQEALLRVAVLGAERGLHDGVCAMQAAVALCDARVLSEEELLALQCVAVTGELTTNKELVWLDAIPSVLEDPTEFLQAFLEEQRSVALGAIAGLAPEVDAAAIVRSWLLPLASLKVWERGSVLLRLYSVAQWSSLLPPQSARWLVSSVARSMTWAVADSELPAWQATRRALSEVRGMRVARLCYLNLKRVEELRLAR